MSFVIRPADSRDASRWVDLAASAFGRNYSMREIYDPEWAAGQLSPQEGHETWVADSGGRLLASTSFLKPADSNFNPVANLGRNLHLPESFADGSADALLKKVCELVTERQQMGVARVSERSLPAQQLYERHKFACVGYQPFKHLVDSREGGLFYVRAARPVMSTRMQISDSLPQVSELATLVLKQLNVAVPMIARDGATGYPLHTEVQIQDASHADYERWRKEVGPADIPEEVSGSYNMGRGIMRIVTNEPSRALLARRDDAVIGGLEFFFDEPDRCIRVSGMFSVNDLSAGPLLRQLLKIAQQQLSATYIEVDVLATAPRLLKTTEQLGFVPVAYLPGFCFRGGAHADAVKLIKLNVGYSLDAQEFAGNASTLVRVIDRNFQDQKLGVAVINLLRGLPIFDGMGDGDLHKISRLFTQKLYRGGECVFRKGDSGDAAFVVMRGQIDIQLDENGDPIATIPSGKIFGELAFLDGAPRNAFAIAKQPTILLRIERSALNDLAHREPYLGLLVMRNVAMDLSQKLRNANTALSALRK